MKFKLDENIPLKLREFLKEYSQDISTVLQQGLMGEEDPLIAEACRKENRILITLDKDFSNIVSYPPATVPGIILFRTASLALTLAG